MKHARSDYDHIQDETGRIPEDEPVFLLRAKDPAAWTTVQFWVKEQRALGNPDEAMLQAVERHAFDMQQWPEKNPNGFADVPAGAMRS